MPPKHAQTSRDPLRDDGSELSDQESLDNMTWDLTPMRAVATEPPLNSGPPPRKYSGPPEAIPAPSAEKSPSNRRLDQYAHIDLSPHRPSAELGMQNLTMHRPPADTSPKAAAMQRTMSADRRPSETPMTHHRSESAVTGKRGNRPSAGDLAGRPPADAVMQNFVRQQRAEAAASSNSGHRVDRAPSDAARASQSRPDTGLLPGHGRKVERVASDTPQGRAPQQHRLDSGGAPASHGKRMDHVLSDLSPQSRHHRPDAGSPVGHGLKKMDRASTDASPHGPAASSSPLRPHGLGHRPDRHAMELTSHNLAVHHRTEAIVPPLRGPKPDRRATDMLQQHLGMQQRSERAEPLLPAKTGGPSLTSHNLAMHHRSELLASSAASGAGAGGTSGKQQQRDRRPPDSSTQNLTMHRPQANSLKPMVSAVMAGSKLWNGSQPETTPEKEPGRTIEVFEIGSREMLNTELTSDGSFISDTSFLSTYNSNNRNSLNLHGGPGGQVHGAPPKGVTMDLSGLRDSQNLGAPRDSVVTPAHGLRDSLTSGAMQEPSPNQGLYLNENGEVDLSFIRRDHLARQNARGNSRVKEDNETARGDQYHPLVWQYYSRDIRAWSDGLCVGLQNLKQLAFCLFPPFWVWRLYLTLRRAAPLQVNLGLCTWWVTRRSACCVAFLASIILVGTCGIGGIFWGCLLLAVGRKYHIRQVEDAPMSFLLKVSCCLCLVNVRAGLHVDRAQGFTKPQRAVNRLVDFQKNEMQMCSPNSFFSGESA